MSMSVLLVVCLALPCVKRIVVDRQFMLVLPMDSYFAQRELWNIQSSVAVAGLLLAVFAFALRKVCLLYTSPSPRD